MQFSYPEQYVFSISSYFFLIVLPLPSVRGDIEDEFIERTSTNQTIKNGIPHLWWRGSKIISSRESKDICNRIAKLTNTYLETPDEPTADKAFPDSVLVFFKNKKYASRIAEVLACEMGSSENYVREKWYIMLWDHRNTKHCYFLLKQFRKNKVVFVDQNICIIDKIEIEDRDESGSDSSVSIPGKNVTYETNSDDVHSFDLTKYHQVEDEFVSYFGNKDTRVLWSAARKLHNLRELELICRQIERFQEGNVETEEPVVVLVGNLLFLQTKYSKMPIDVISCGRTNAEDFPHDIYVTRGKCDDCYFLLDRFKQRNFFVSEHVCV